MGKINSIVFASFLLIGISLKAEELITKNIEISNSIDKVEFSYGHNLFLKQGEKAELKVIMSKSLENELDVNTSGTTVILKLKGHESFLGKLFGYGEYPDITDKKLDYYLTLPNLKEIKAGYSGKINISDLNVNEKLILDLFGSGQFFAEKIKAEEVCVDLKGSGSCNINKLNTVNCVIDSSGSGSVNIDDLEGEELTFGIAGSSNVSVKSGKTKNQSVSILGSASYEASGLESRKCDITIAGSGSAYVYVLGNISINLMGSSDLKVKGNPKAKDITTLGSSHLSFE